MAALSRLTPYVGGKKRNNKHRNRTEAAGKKVAVMTLIDRDGEARTFKVPNTKKGIMQAIAIPNVDGTAHIITDEHKGYEGLERHFGSHHTVNHSETYVRGIIFHTNFAELDPLAPKAVDHRHASPHFREALAPVSAGSVNFTELTQCHGRRAHD